VYGVVRLSVAEDEKSEIFMTWRLQTVMCMYLKIVSVSEHRNLKPIHMYWMMLHGQANCTPDGTMQAECHTHENHFVLQILLQHWILVLVLSIRSSDWAVSICFGYQSRWCVKWSTCISNNAGPCCLPWRWRWWFY
jgi:hypothetical protein